MKYSETNYDGWLEGPYQRMVEQGEAEMLAREQDEKHEAELQKAEPLKENQ